MKKKCLFVTLMSLLLVTTLFAAPYGDLQIVNNTLCDSNGNPVQLRGWSQLDLMQPDTGWVTGATIPNLKAFCPGLNAVRIAMYTEEFGYGYMEQNTSGKENYRNKVKALINDAIQADLYVLVDWHILNDTNPWSDEYKNGSRDFFTDIARDYGHYDNVLFELCNEPKQVSFTGTIKPYAEYVLAGIRQYSDNIVVVGTPTWCQDIDHVVGNKISSNLGRGVMYALHFYAATHYQWLRDNGNTALRGNVPVILSEWGTVSASGDGSTDYNNSRDWMNWADQNNISWFNWSWSIRRETSAAIANGNLAGPWSYHDLSASGKWVYDRINAGPTPPVSATNTPTPAPTPTPTATPAVIGNSLIRFVPPSTTVGTGESFTTSIYLDVSNSNVAAYGFNITYNSSMVGIDTSRGTDGAAPGADGYLAAVNSGTPGTITISGFHITGKGPGYNLHFLDIFWTAQYQKGSTNLGLSVDCLSDVNYQNLGYQINTGTITITDTLLGDVDGNGNINIVDALMTAQYYVSLNPQGFNPAAADVDRNGAITIVDALKIAQFYVGLITSF